MVTVERGYYTGVFIVGLKSKNGFQYLNWVWGPFDDLNGTNNNRSQNAVLSWFAVL
jgi:hypothetical protein